jgi:hypothetical protein
MTSVRLGFMNTSRGEVTLHFLEREHPAKNCHREAKFIVWVGLEKGMDPDGSAVRGALETPYIAGHIGSKQAICFSSGETTPKIFVELL